MSLNFASVELISEGFDFSLKCRNKFHLTDQGMH